MIRVALVEDDDEIRAGFRLLLDAAPGIECAGAFRDAESALPALEAEPPDVVLMDIRLPGASGVEAARRLKAACPRVDIIMLTVHREDALVFESLSAGATGYLTKDAPPARIMDAIREVRAGGAPMSAGIARRIVDSFRAATASPLTRRETEVLEQLCAGHSYRAIARALHISEPTVHFHIKHIYQKLQVHSKSAAVARALRDRLV